MTLDIQHVNSGDRVQFSAAMHNRLVEMIAEYVRGHPSEQTSDYQTNKCYVFNEEDVALEMFAVVGLGDPKIAPPTAATPGASAFKFNKVVKSASPSSSQPFGILQRPAPIGGIADIVVGGETMVLVNFTSAAHEYAAPAAGDYQKLVSQSAAGPVRVLWKDPDGATTGVKWAWVLIDNMGPGVGGSGITSINGDETAAQEIGLGIAGSDLNVATTAAAWSSTQTYQKGWMVSSGGSTWRCILAHTNQVPPNATYWEDVTGHGLHVVNVPKRTLNGSEAYAQVFIVDNSGVDFSISTIGANHTFSIPNAGIGARGLINTSQQSIAGDKHFVGDGFTYSVTIGPYAGGFPVSHCAWLDHEWDAISSESNFNLRSIATTGSVITIASIGSPFGSDPGSFTIYSTSNAFSTTNAVRYAVYHGGFLYGAWGTDPIGNVVSGGIITTLGSGPLSVAGGGTGLTTIPAGKLLAGNGTSPIDSLDDTRVSGDKLELKADTDRWVAFSKGSF